MLGAQSWALNLEEGLYPNKKKNCRLQSHQLVKDKSLEQQLTECYLVSKNLQRSMTCRFFEMIFYLH